MSYYRFLNNGGSYKLNISQMADVSLDDLIKKDKEKGRVTKLKQVEYHLRRN